MASVSQFKLSFLSGNDYPLGLSGGGWRRRGRRGETELRRNECQGFGALRRGRLPWTEPGPQDLDLFLKGCWAEPLLRTERTEWPLSPFRRCWALTGAALDRTQLNETECTSGIIAVALFPRRHPLHPPQEGIETVGMISGKFIKSTFSESGPPLK